MLVLSRKEGQQVVIGNDIVVTIKDIAGGRVQFAVSAPKDIRILRGELLEQSTSMDVVEAAH